MSEKRIPEITILLRMKGKKSRQKQKVELFCATDFGQNYCSSTAPQAKRYRARVNGKWFTNGGAAKYYFMSKWDFRDLLWRSYFK